MSHKYKYLFATLLFSVSQQLYSTSSAGTTTVSLDSALKNENVNGGIVNFDMGNVTLSKQVRAVQSDGTFTFVPSATITINGMNNQLDGSTSSRGFFVGGSGGNGTGSVTINNLNFVSCTAKGGNSMNTSAGSPAGGGGGLGAGGGLFVAQGANVILVDCTFQNCAAQGGNSRTGMVNVNQGGPGGGMRGNGVTAGFNALANQYIFGGGGGFGGDGASANPSGTPEAFGGGASAFISATTTTPGSDFNGGTTQGASGVGGGNTTVNGGYGGGGGGSGFNNPVGSGDFGGGGACGSLVSGTSSNGGDGGFGGGGGSSSLSTGGTGSGGFGGFGAGSGSSQTGAVDGGFGGGDGNATGGGAGAGFGGAIFIQQGGVLTLQGSVSFSGNSATAGTSGNANAIASEGLGAMGQDIFMMSSSQLIFDITSNVTMPSKIEGNQGVGGGSTTTGGLTKQGPATLILTGDNTYTGTTTVQAGELQINGSVVSDIVVQSGATLSGNFATMANIPATGGGTITNSGIVSPGVGGVGTISLHNFVQTSMGTLLADITPTAQVDDKLLLDMTGSAMIDGTLNVVINNGNYIAGTQYTIINGPTSGSFVVVKSGAQAANVDITVSFGSLIVSVVNNQLFGHQILNPGIPTAVANAITAEPITPGTDFAYVVTVLGTLSNSAVNQALTAMSPVMFGTLEWINERNNSYVASLLTQHLFQLSCSPRNCQDTNNSVWGTVFGNTMNNYKKFDNLTPYTANGVGGLVGYDYCFPHFTFGLSGGYTHTNLDWKGDLGGGNLNSYYGAVYGSWTVTHWSVDAAILAGGNENDLHRKIEFSTINRNARSDFWSYLVTGHLGVESDWAWGQGTFVPFALADYNYYNRNSFNEHGADSIDLAVRGKTEQMMRGEAGIKAYYTIKHENSCYAPYVALSWVGEFPLEASRQKANFRGRPPVMDVKSYDSSIQLVSPQVGFKATSNHGFSFIAGYKGLFNNKTSINEVEGRLEWVF